MGFVRMRNRCGGGRVEFSARGGSVLWMGPVYTVEGGMIALIAYYFDGGAGLGRFSDDT